MSWKRRDENNWINFARSGFELSHFAAIMLRALFGALSLLATSVSMFYQSHDRKLLTQSCRGGVWCSRVVRFAFLFDAKRWKIAVLLGADFFAKKHAERKIWGECWALRIEVDRSERKQSLSWDRVRKNNWRNWFRRHREVGNFGRKHSAVSKFWLVEEINKMIRKQGNLGFSLISLRDKPDEPEQASTNRSRTLRE